jgi:hypothetical protein
MAIITLLWKDWQQKKREKSSKTVFFVSDMYRFVSKSGKP